MEYQPAYRPIAPALVRSSITWFLGRDVDRPASVSEYFAMQLFPIGLTDHPATKRFDPDWLFEFSLTEARFLSGNGMCMTAIGSVVVFALASWQAL